MTAKNKANDAEKSSKFLHRPFKRNNKWITMAVLFLILLSIVLLALVFYFALRTKDDDICRTKDCVLTASILIDAMDTTVDPCQNFQKFGCANFMRKHPVAEEEISKTTWELFNTYFDLQMKDVFETLNPYGQPDVIIRIQEAYHVCINTTFQEEKEFEALKKFATDDLQWPLAFGEQWKPKISDITSFLLHFYDNSISNELFSIWTHNHQNDSSKLVVKIRALSVAVFLNEEDLHRDNKTEEGNLEKQKAELTVLKELVKLLGNNDSESIDKDLEDMKNLSKYEMEWNSTSETYPEEITIEKLTKLSGNRINWLDVITRIVKKENASYTVSPMDTITLIDPGEVFRNIEICKRFPLRVISNNIGWDLIFPDVLSKAGPIGEKLILNHFAEHYDIDIETLTKRWLTCIRFLEKFYPMAITRMFVDRYINRSDKTSADEMIMWLQKAYRAAISQSTWVDDETKKNAINKADKIRRHVGYPDYIFDDSALDKEYAKMPKIQSTQFLNWLNHVKMSYTDTDMENSLNHEKWFIYPLVVNAFYSPHSNSIWFPTGILQLPFFDDTRLAAVNFGMIGSIIGHEIGHAFDDDGSKYNENGEENNWWTDKTRTVFENKAQCFVDQYNEFCPEELQGHENETFCVDGEYTLGENLADYTGILASFAAYKMWVKEHGPEKRLPGLQEYSPEQVFFISLAYTWCENIPPDHWYDSYKYDSHAPGYYRILGPLSNSKEFRETFNCPEGPMNRGKNSCTMW